MNRAVILFNIYLCFLFCFTPALIAIGFLLNCFPHFKSSFFAKLQSFFRVNDSNEWQFIENKRKKLLEPLKNLKSRDATLKRENSVRILEFGIGKGTNFNYFPPNTRLVAVDANNFAEETLVTNLKKYDNIQLEKFLVTSPAQLDELENESVDAVICSHVFCSVDDQPAVAKELKRVLVQGGKFYFLEHVGYRNRLFRLMQWLVSPLWRVWFNNCRLGYQPKPILLRAGFADVSMEYFENKDHHFFIRPNVAGVATKLV